MGAAGKSVAEVVANILAVQAQDPRGARLAIRARTRGLTARAVDEALTRDRSLLISWLNRGTLHLVQAEDYVWLHPLTTPPVARGNLRRLAQEGVSPDAAEKGVAAIVRSLRRNGRQLRGELREQLEAQGIPVAGQAMVHLLLLASLRGLIVRGPMVRGGHAFVLTAEWLPPSRRPFVRDAALAELARRYLVGHGPASAADLAKWAGLPLRDARGGLSAIAAELQQGPAGLVDLRRRRGGPGLGPPRLLGPFDPLLMGWSSREPILGGRAGVVTSNGLFRPFILANGRAVGTWSLAAGRVTLKPFDALPPGALRAEEADVLRFLDGGAEESDADLAP